jgi:hypothetical protein
MHAERPVSDTPERLPSVIARAEELALTLRRWVTGEPLAEDEVHGAVCEYTRALRLAGAPPETALIAVKSAACPPGLTSVRTAPERARLTRIVQWCIAEYYRGD